MNQSDMNDRFYDEITRARHCESVEVHLPYVITTYGEIIPFSRLRRLSLNNFNDEDGFADELASDVNVLPNNHMYAELDDKTRCILDLDVIEFQNIVNSNSYGMYTSTISLKDIVIKQFVRMYEATKT